MICLCLTGETLSQWGEQLSRNRKSVELVELRVDLLRPAERTVENVAQWWNEYSQGIPAILTIRRTNDGGHWEGDNAQRLVLFSRLREALRPAYIDIELDRASGSGWVQLAGRHEEAGGTVIRSYHGSVEREEEIAQLMARLAKNPREIPKLALTAQTLRMTTAVLRAARQFRRNMPGRKALWVAVGAFGLPSRVDPALFESAWTYASDGSLSPAAEGQYTPAELSAFPLSRVEKDWKRFAVVGSPIRHSRSPLFHNRSFTERGNRAFMIPVHAAEFANVVDFLREGGLCGAAVTVPFKAHALSFARQHGQVTDRANVVGAANTLYRTAGGEWVADNTDVVGVIAPLREVCGLGKARRAAVIGAGGAARATVYALLADGWDVRVYNRTVAHAQELVESVGGHREAAYSLEALREVAPGAFDLVVQTTPIGMEGGIAGDPSAAYRFDGHEIAYDLIYAPPQTAFLARAAQAGCRTLNGEGMFLGQAAEQQRIFREACIGD